ncbi:MAG: nucleotide exchange factor GrpE [Deltaproteobacteria bacterium]|nr:nucleotide exchange factor GrpE [Deltaproteobacteria bacterium]MBW1962393.1 nucleotide exchange factor GrpE [Deltaproteobacteria bacterium]MBW2153550.1 nucleotide exchange factor GrpE [Deltaproteobacteria bacterium]
MKEEILRRFESWLDAVLAEEEPPAGIAKDLLDELKDPFPHEKGNLINDRDDLFSTWSAVTALTQEVKLQGRTFKQLNERLESLLGSDTNLDSIAVSFKEAVLEVVKLSENIEKMQRGREEEFKKAAREAIKQEFIEIFINIRDRLLIGLRSAEESQRQLESQAQTGRLKRFFFQRRGNLRRMLEIVDSLKKGYWLGLDRLEEMMDRLDLHEITCSGKPFDPQFMTAVDIEETDEVPDGTVMEVYQTGYIHGDQIVKPAQVKVARTRRKSI